MTAKKNWKEAPAKERAKKIIAALAKEYEPVCALHFRSAFELLIATILSAQCTDERVNQVTQVLFQRYPDAKALAAAAEEDVEDIVRPTGFFRQKTQSIIGVSQALSGEFGGEVPAEMDQLIQLPGIGRKTANVVLGTAFGLPAVMVDTHVKRLSNRLGLSKQSNPDKIEQDLIAVIPEKERTDFSHRLIWHGRKVCAARKPRCESCILSAYCPSEGVV
ncbi:MAG: endonuclease III [Candidatus Omnitrophica bacterium]|nr:endonuclease III [Candidatus Omnitrophota bacterium]